MHSQFRDNWGLWLHRAAVGELGLSAAEAIDVAARHGRDKCRTPMQWSNAPNAGFSPEGATTWLPVHPNHADGVNVAEQLDDAGSLLSFYRRLIRVRRSQAALSRGDCTLLDTDDPDVLAYVRTADGESCVVVLNMAGGEPSVGLDLPRRTLRGLCCEPRPLADRGPGRRSPPRPLRGLRRGDRVNGSIPCAIGTLLVQSANTEEADGAEQAAGGSALGRRPTGGRSGSASSAAG